MKKTRKKSFRLTTRLVLLGFIVLIVPWLGMQSLTTMKNFLLEGQEQAQLLSVRGIATQLRDRPELFTDISPPLEGFAELPLYLSRHNKLLDGYEDDWQHLVRFKQYFGDSHGFSLVMAQSNDMLYGLVNVQDATPVTRHPGFLRMDNSDHLRFYLQDANGDELRILLTFEGNGSAIAYRMDESWKYASPGTPEYGIGAEVVINPQGYDVEFRMPLSWLGARKQLGLLVADVEDDSSREVVGLEGTFPRFDGGHFNPVIVRSSEVETILRSFGEGNTRLWFLDREQRVRAVVGQLQTVVTQEDYQRSGKAGWQLLLARITGWLVGIDDQVFKDFEAETVQTRNDAIYQQALKGSAVMARRASLDGNAQIITAAYPVRVGNKVMGVLLLEKSTRDILQLQRRSLEALAGFTVLGMFAVTLALLAFSSRLAWRIHRLEKDTRANVDENGRFAQALPIRGSKSGDEIGALAKTIEKVLVRLNQHQQFLTNIPRTLRHEINNPLNTISTSLDRLEKTPEAKPYIDRAQRGLGRINHVVNALAEAANLEQSLQSESLELVNLTALVNQYVRYQSGQNQQPVGLDIAEYPMPIFGSGEHLEQMLDKLLDNARDFSAGVEIPEGGEAPIVLSLQKEGEKCILAVSNKGPLIPQDQFDQLFYLMSSHRNHSAGGEHLGLGLYVAKVIAEHHGGQIEASNLDDGSGVVFKVILPLSPGKR